jgi:surface polysaccharide O-acyltransferase-like enzyme
VDAFRVYAMLFVILAHTELAIGATRLPIIPELQLALNVVGRFVVPLFFLLAGEHLGPRLLRDRAPDGSWFYVRRLAMMFAAASLFYWIFDIARLARRLGLGAGLAEFAARQGRDPILILLQGGRPHLWFLVVLMIVVAAAGVVLARRRVRTFVFSCAVLYVLGLAIGPYVPLLGLHGGRLWFEWVLQSPLFFALGVFFSLEREHVARRGLATVLIVGGLALHTAEVYWLSTTYGTWPFRLGMLIGTVPYTIGVALLAFSPGATRLDRIAGRFVAFVPAVYLGHMVFVETLLPPRGQFNEIAVRILLPVLTAVLSFGSAALLARLLMRVRRQRRLRAAAARLATTTPAAP